MSDLLILAEAQIAEKQVKEIEAIKKRLGQDKEALKEAIALEKIQNELRECINHAYRDTREDMQKFGSNITHLDNAIKKLNELVKIHKAESEG